MNKREQKALDQRNQAIIDLTEENSRLRSDLARRCAECNCEHGDGDCNWIAPAKPCPECANELPSMNWKNGKPYFYCPECGRTDLKE